MKQNIGIKNATVTIYNKQGFKFTQQVGDTGDIFRPRGFSGETRMFIQQELPGGKNNFFSIILPPKSLILQESKEFHL